MADNATGRFEFDSDALPERDRFPAFCEEMFRRVVGADIERTDLLPFHGALSMRRAGCVKIADLTVTPATITRAKSHLNDGDDDLVFQYWRQGLGYLNQAEQNSQINSTGTCLIDNAKVARVSIGVPSRFISLGIPRNRIPTIGLRIASGGGTKIEDNLSLRLLRGYLEVTLSQDLSDHRVAQLFGDHLVDLVVHALGDNEGQSSQEGRGGLRAARKVEILRNISQQFSDPNLSAAVIARRFGITARYVHRLLEETGRNFNQHLLDKRLEQAAALLRNPKWHERRISDIARETGFVEQTHFNRTFRQKFGQTPSDVRADARKLPLDGMS
jgi:AraC-like DNA-binding protein